MTPHAEQIQTLLDIAQRAAADCIAEILKDTDSTRLSREGLAKLLIFAIRTREGG